MRRAASTGEGTVDELVPALFDELRELAHRKLAREFRPVTIQTTELVHEAYLRLHASPAVARRGKAYFFAAAGRAMRQVLIDAARRRTALKRGGGARHLSLRDADRALDAFGGDLLALDEALERLEDVHPRAARVVEGRFFGGLSMDEVAATLGVSVRTAQADWALARAWLYDELRATAA